MSSVLPIPDVGRGEEWDVLTEYFGVEGVGDLPFLFWMKYVNKVPHLSRA